MIYSRHYQNQPHLNSPLSPTTYSTQLARGLTRVPGAPSYLLYSAALLTWPPTSSPKGVVKGLAPLLLREFFTALAAGLDMLQILGVSSEAASGPAAAARCGPRRPMPSSLSTVSLVLEVNKLLFCLSARKIY